MYESLSDKAAKLFAALHEKGIETNYILDDLPDNFISGLRWSAVSFTFENRSYFAFKLTNVGVVEVFLYDVDKMDDYLSEVIDCFDAADPDNAISIIDYCKWGNEHELEQTDPARIYKRTDIVEYPVGVPQFGQIKNKLFRRLMEALNEIHDNTGVLA